MLRSDILELEHATTAQEAFDSVRACTTTTPNRSRWTGEADLSTPNQ